MKYNAFKYHDSYNDSMYSEQNRIKNLWAELCLIPGFAILYGTPINRAEGAARLARMATIQIGICEVITLHPEMGGIIHLQADVRRADDGQFIMNLMRCINYEKSRAANDHTNYVRFLLKEIK